MPVLAAFNQGECPTIACFNKAVTPLGVELDLLIAAMQAYVDNYVAPVWGTPAKLIRSTDFVLNAWAMVFLDDADQPGALAYHDLTPGGWPLSKVFVKTTLANHDLVSVSASHELVEMLVDPAINMMTTGPDPALMFAYESADPVEELYFEVNGMPMSNFVFPSYFENFRPVGGRFDYMSKVTKPFEILPGGYQIVFKDGKWTQVYGSVAKQKRFAREDRHGHRSESRGEELVRSDEREIARERARSHNHFKSVAPTGVQSAPGSYVMQGVRIPSWDEIKAYFTDTDVQHMLSETNGELNLHDCASVLQNAAAIYRQVSSGGMPPGNPWGPDKINGFYAWWKSNPSCS